MKRTHPSLPEIPTEPGVEIPIPRRYDRLLDLAYNMWWSWDAGARDLWQRLSPSDWALSPNPLTVLQTVAPETWDGRTASKAFRVSYEDVIGRFDA